MIRSALAAFLVLFAWAAIPAASAAGTSPSARAEAERQIKFARGEVAESRFERALSSAESALRLCPECREATLLKALSYDGLGDRRLAVSLLKAYKEEAPEEDHPKADRILEWFASTPRSRPDPLANAAFGKGFADVGGLGARPPELDAAPYRARLTAALEAGRCATARVAAEELVRALPDDATAWSAAVPAVQCSGDVGMASRLLTRLRSAGDQDPAAISTLERIAGDAGRIRVDLPPSESGWSWLLDAGGEWIAPRRAGASLDFRGVPPGASLRLVGIEAGGSEPRIGVEIPPLKKKEERVIDRNRSTQTP